MATRLRQVIAALFDHAGQTTYRAIDVEGNFGHGSWWASHQWPRPRRTGF